MINQKYPIVIETEEIDGVFCPKFSGPIYYEPEKKPDHDLDVRQRTKTKRGLADLIFKNGT